MFSLLFFLLIIFGPRYPSTDFLNKILFSSQNPPYPKSNLHSERLLRVEEEERESSPIRMRVAESRHQFFTNPVCDSSLHLLFSKRLCYMLKTGTLSYQEFENELLDFIERAKNIQDSWNVEFPKVRSLRTVAEWAQGLIQCYMPGQLNV